MRETVVVEAVSGMHAADLSALVLNELLHP
jgi:hypothetical protein